jgi:photosystem II stability/assembly factor-like uncharacterized protein
MVHSLRLLVRTFANWWGVISTNNGKSWTEINRGLTATCAFSFAEIDRNLFAGTINGVFLSTNNGKNWTSVNDGLINTNVHHFNEDGFKSWVYTLVM